MLHKTKYKGALLPTRCTNTALGTNAKITENTKITENKAQFCAEERCLSKTSKQEQQASLNFN
jgi:hypothetical protein